MNMELPGYATRVDQLSFSSCYLELHGEGASTRHASGFLWRAGNEIYLVTNWHVVTGKNIFNGEFMEHGWCPQRIVLDLMIQGASSAGSVATSNREISIERHELRLYHDFHSPLWLQHRMTFDWNVDIALLRLDASKISNASRIICVNDYKFERLFHYVGADILVIGHPLSNEDSKYPVTFPTWKRGSIASELFIPWNMRPAFLADVRTSQGMSGSPVIRRAFGPATMADLTTCLDKVVTSEFMGIYSGRLYDDERNASVGLVWYRNLIDQIISSPAVGSREWTPSTVRGIKEILEPTSG